MALGGHSLILALDEFEALERAVEAGRIGREMYQFLRSKTQERWVTIVFGGLHTLDEMTRDYAQPFYGSYRNIAVSYLSPREARKLITEPNPDFDLNYAPEAVERIINESGGQPYLVQSICSEAVALLNHELYDLELDRPVEIGQADIERVLGPDFFRKGMVYFDGVWTQTKDEPEVQPVLHHMAGRDEAWSLAELCAQLPTVPEAQMRILLQWATRHDIVRRLDGPPERWQFCVPLMRRWILENARTG